MGTMVNRVSKGYKWLIILLAAVGSNVCYMSIWLFYSFYDLIQVHFNASSVGMGLLGTISGGLMLLGYPVGGIIVDKLGLRKAAVICAAYTAVDFILLSQSSNFNTFLAAEAISCFGTGIAVAEYNKLVKFVSVPDTEGKNNGFLWMLYSASGSLIGLIVAYIVNTSGEESGWQLLCLFYGILSAVIAIVSIIFIKEDKFNEWSVMNKPDEDNAFHFRDLGKIILMPELWLISVVYFCTLMINAAGTYAVSMMRTVFLVPLGIVTAINVFKANFARIAIAPISGVLRDKFKSCQRISRLLIIIALVGFVIFFAFPMNEKYMWVGIVLVLTCTIAYSLECVTWAVPVSEIGISSKYFGTAVGIFNALGCIGDMFIYVLCGNWLTKYGTEGNRYIFGFIGAMLIIGFVASLLETRMQKKRLAKESSN